MLLFCYIFDQVNVALVSIRDFFQQNRSQMGSVHYPMCICIMYTIQKGSLHEKKPCGHFCEYCANASIIKPVLLKLVYFQVGKDCEINQLMQPLGNLMSK